MNPTSYIGCRVLLLLIATVSFALTPTLSHGKQPKPGHLEIHYIDVGQGGATLIIGPNGTMIMYDFGKVAGEKAIVPYLTNIVGLEIGDHIHYAMVSHGDLDHYMGYKGVVSMPGKNGQSSERFRILVANFEPSTDKPRSSTMLSHWLGPAEKTRAGPFKPIPVGLHINLGDGAEARVIAANGIVLDDLETPKIKNENDRSIALFVRYGNFRYILDGDLGSGREKCTAHDTGQLNVQERVARALIKHELMSVTDGVDIMHVAHHGSESSTSSKYYNLMKPEVALISVGKNQGEFLHPRVDVVEKVLLNVARPRCVEAPPVRAVLQTGPGTDKPCSDTGCTSFKGWVAGNIVVTTDGKTTYKIRVDKPPPGNPPHFQLPATHPWEFPLSAGTN